MDKSCLHCQQGLSFLRAVRGELFCSSDHRELYFQTVAAVAFERVALFDAPAGPDGTAVDTTSPSHAEEMASPAAEVRPHGETKRPILEDPPSHTTSAPMAEEDLKAPNILEITEPTAKPRRPI